MKKILSGLAALLLIGSLLYCFAFTSTEVVISHQVEGWPTSAEIVVDAQGNPDNYVLRAPKLPENLRPYLDRIEFEWSNAPGYWNGSASWENRQGQDWAQHSYTLTGGIVLTARPINGPLARTSDMTAGQCAWAFGTGSYMPMHWAQNSGLPQFDGTPDLAGPSSTSFANSTGYNELHLIPYEIWPWESWAKRWACWDQTGQGEVKFYAKPYGDAKIHFAPGDLPSHWSDTDVTWDHIATLIAQNSVLWIRYVLKDVPPELLP